MASIGKRFKARRIALGYTQLQLARKLRTTKQRVAHIEADRVRLPISELAKWAAALKSEVASLVPELAA